MTLRLPRSLLAVTIVSVATIAAGAQGGVHPVSGRQFALPMGVGGAPWLDRSEREAEEAPTKALELIGVPRGATVADVGAGSGYFTLKLAALVGPTGKVLATDIQKGMLDIIQRKLQDNDLNNVTLILGVPDDPKLPADALDLILMVDVYHELSQPQVVLGHMRRALKSDGRLVLIEYKGEDPTVPILPLHKMTVAQAKLELEHEGFTLKQVNSSLPRQHILTFVK